MALHIPQSDRLKVGTYDARLQSVIELGAHSTVYMGKRKAPSFQVKFVFELYDEDNVYYAGKDYNLTLNEQGNFLKVLSALYRTQDSKEIGKRIRQPGATAELIGIPVVVQINEFEKDGKSLTYVDSVIAMDKRVVDQVPPLVKEPVVFEFDRDDAVEVFKTLTPYTRKKIMSAENADLYSTELKTAAKDIEEDTATMDALR